VGAVTDRSVVVLAALALAGAWLARPVPFVLVAAAAGAAVVGRRSVLVVLAVALAASALGARAWDGVRSAPTAGEVRTGATLVTDPEWVMGGVRAELRLDDDGRRVQATASGDAGALLASRLAGERVHVEGRRRPLSPGSRAFLARRHIGAGVQVDEVTDPGGGGPVARFTNQLRRTLVAGTDSMSVERRALFTGLVLGDDREQEDEEIDDFRASGLTHLLAVSGQNVAFVLAVAAPFLRRLGLRGRLAAAVPILVAFGTLTRWEPSVVRAVAMAGLALFASTVGRPAASVRVLALAVTALVLVDPMLAGSVGFLLSVGACAGIAVVGPILERRRVPAALAVTVAAQVGVAPILVPVFGGVSLASLPANLLAGPAAGPVMVWGLVGGLPAGLLGGRMAWLLHVPTRLLLDWIAGVARLSARLALPEVEAAGFGVLAAAAALVVLARKWRVRGPRVAVTASAVALAGLLVTSQAATPRRGTDAESIAAGAQLWRRDGATVLVLAGNADGGRLLEALRRRGVRRVDVLVLRSGGSGGARLAGLVRHRAEVRLALAPAGHRVPGAEVFVPGQRARAGPLEVVAEGGRERLEVRVGSPAPCVSPSGPASTTCRRAPS
jgi:competence protein ComEC